MTSPTRHDRYAGRHFAPALRLDIYTRYLLRHHLWFIVVAFMAILGAVTAINVSSEVGRVWREGANTGFSDALGRTAAYIWYRILDNGSQVFPIGFLLGVVWAETAHAASGRLAMARTVGLPFGRRSVALFILAGASVPTQFLLDNVVRPYAFMSLSTQGLGEYGWDFKSERSPRVRWIAFGGRVVQATLLDAPEPRFGEATIYDFDRQGDLERVTVARELVLAFGSDVVWRPVDALTWRIWRPGGMEPAVTSDIPTGADTATGNLNIQISPLWLQYRNIHPKYIPIADLAALSGDAMLPDNPPKYREWLYIRLSQAFVPGLVATCIAALIALVLDRAGLLMAAGAGLATSYLGYFSARIATIAVESHLGPPVAAAFGLPMLLAAIATALLVGLRQNAGPNART